jgi:cellulose synthase/poly-beta-1,6-N-acetylglucosamine synthase-like glycosyltransferase
MLNVTEFTLWTLYLIPAIALMLFGLNMYVLLGLFFVRRRRARRELSRLMTRFRDEADDADLPQVVTQIPVYNEFNVVERAMRAAAAMDYPADRHTVQVLDDSTDETRSLIDRVAEDLLRQGQRVHVIRRPNRTGFKAGALQYGMLQTEATCLAIFDADFVPPSDFLRRTVPVLMMSPDVGLVQARWGHLNPEASFITRAQHLGIDSHFGIEQGARAWNNLFMNFNGTAGLWRRQAIDDAGGWEHDTLTEDMDLSYRAQLAGWKPFYLTDLVVPAEIPEDINAFKSQQFRWAKGSIQTAMKLLPRVLRSPCTFAAKVQAAFHMMGYLIHPAMVAQAIFSLPWVLTLSFAALPMTASVFFILIILSAIAPAILCASAQCALNPHGWRKLSLIPLLTALGVGIAISNTRAVAEALIRRDTPFIRTPKRGDSHQKSYTTRRDMLPVVELIVGGYCFVTAFAYFDARLYLAGPFLALYAVGFTLVGCLSILHRRAQQTTWA